MMLKELLRTDRLPSTRTTTSANLHYTEQTSSAATPPLLHEFFERQADLRPEAIAVIHGKECVTYTELDHQANRMAHHLHTLGVQNGSRVAILLPRSIGCYAAMLGTLKAGAAYVPLDPSHPADRLRYIVEDAQVDALISTSEMTDALQDFHGIVIRTDSDRALIAEQSSIRLSRSAVSIAPHDLCYLIYTSGSTGRPKGVMIEHRNASHLVQEEGQLFGVQPQDRVYQGAPLTFDLSVEEVWLAFRSGATLIAATPEMVTAGPDLGQLLNQAGVTVLSCVPTLLAMFNDNLPALRLLILDGEACSPALVSRCSRPGRRIVNTYGPTEATVISTYAELAPDKPVQIGRPLPGYQIHILDNTLRPVPHGEVGEICIGGAGVARGYVGLAEENAAHFVPDPFSPQHEAGARLYRTGDLGRIDGDDMIECLGRTDGQIKLRGFRIELSEIETALLQEEGVSAAACSLREDQPGVQQLIAYIVPEKGPIADETTLRQHLRSQLPAYMVPALIEPLDELPTLPSGKLDRSSLPPPRPRKRATQAAGRRPRTPTECKLAHKWEELFQPLPIGIDDDFFCDLGGHSLLAARAVSALRRDPQFYPCFDDRPLSAPDHRQACGHTRRHSTAARERNG